MICPGEIISHAAMSLEEGAHLQRGMNFRLRNEISVLLMSVRRGAPYEDRLLEDGRVLIYEGHDAHRIAGGPAPKECDQPEQTPKGKPTQNALFFKAAVRFKTGKGNAEQVRVYEKIRDGIWVFNGVFRLVDAWKEKQGARTVFKFRLAISKQTRVSRRELRDLSHVRMIPSAVKLEVWKRDRGRCVKCGRQENLHFDHDLPFSRGGTSLLARNIQLLCARHNLAKKNRIE